MMFSNLIRKARGSDRYTSICVDTRDRLARHLALRILRNPSARVHIVEHSASVYYRLEKLDDGTWTVAEQRFSRIYRPIRLTPTMPFSETESIREMMSAHHRHA